MTSLLDTLGKFFTLQAICGYVAGATVAMVINWLLDKRNHTDRLARMKLMAVIWAVMVLFVGYVAIGIERNTVCIVEVLDTLAARAELSDQADELQNDRDDGATNWIITKDNPPPEIASLKWENPVRQEWIHAQDRFYVQIIKDAQNERRKTIAEKASHKVPESRCGKN